MFKKISGIILVMGLMLGAVVVGCSKDSGTNPTPTPNVISFDSGVMSASSSGTNHIFSFTFNDTGRVGYHCCFHGAAGSGMHGTIVVGPSTGSPQTVDFSIVTTTLPDLNLKKGDRVNWTNNDPSNRPHTVTTDNHACSN